MNPNHPHDNVVYIFQYNRYTTIPRGKIIQMLGMGNPFPILTAERDRRKKEEHDSGMDGAGTRTFTIEMSPETKEVSNMCQWGYIIPWYSIIMAL
jgi:hypothetical protein